MATNNDKRTLLTETPKVGVYPDIESFNKGEKERQKQNRELLTDAIADAKAVRNSALANAEKALIEAFGNNYKDRFKKPLDAPQQSGSAEPEMTQIASVDLEKMLDELGMELADDEMLKECKKRLDEAKDPAVSASEKDRMYRDIHRKFWAYVQSLPSKSIALSEPVIKKIQAVDWKGGIQWISHEGSLIVSALIGVSESGNAYVAISQLPSEDRDIVNGRLYDTLKKRIEVGGFLVRFDEYKNFEFTFDGNGDARPIKFTLGNRVSSIPPNESSRFGTDVKIEKKGKDILIGDRIKLEKNKVQAAVQGQEPHPHTLNPNRNGGFTPRQKVAGRNAYEIRADILEMALDWAKHKGDKGMDANDILDIADAFYEFVEQK